MQNYNPKTDEKQFFTDMAEANAKLIAAAPDMLQALQEIPTECDHKEPHLSACWVCLVKETIKKATI